MRVVGIETSSRRGTVALVESGQLVALRAHEELNAHGERMLALVQAALADAGWEPRSLTRVAVGTGPGAFTGLRVGLSIAQGLGLGLGIPVVGVGSLRAMCLGAPASLPGVRLALLDARRGEVFAAAHDAAGAELAPPRLVPRDGVAALAASLGPGPVTLLGEVAPDVAAGLPVLRSAETDLPHAHPVALAAPGLTEAEAPPEPCYVRAPDAIRPNLPRSPLSSGDSR